MDRIHVLDRDDVRDIAEDALDNLNFNCEIDEGSLILLLERTTWPATVHVASVRIDLKELRKALENCND